MKKCIIALVLCLAALLVLGRAAMEAAEEHFSPDIPALSSDISPAIGSDETRLAELLESMSLEEKVWQMMFVYPQDVSGELCCTDAAMWAAALEARPVGGMVFLSENMPSGAQLKAALYYIRSAAPITPFLGLDEEGGAVARLSYTLGLTTDFKPMYYYREDGPTTAYANAKTIASDIAAFGFNTDFAPVADVWTNSENSVIGRRAYSHEPAEAALLVAAAVRGFADGGVISTLKHFPGHGDTAEDSHYSSAYSSKTLAQLRECEFLPFISGIRAGADMVMVGHITLPEIDPQHPATLSKSIVSGLLRGELGFDGVVITDAFGMNALGEYPEAEAAVLAIEAGCDIILGAEDPDSAVKAIMENVSEERIDESVMRILTLKMEKGLI